MDISETERRKSSQEETETSFEQQEQDVATLDSQQQQQGKVELHQQQHEEPHLQQQQEQQEQLLEADRRQQLLEQRHHQQQQQLFQLQRHHQQQQELQQHQQHPHQQQEPQQQQLNLPTSDERSMTPKPLGDADDVVVVVESDSAADAYDADVDDVVDDGVAVGVGVVDRHKSAAGVTHEPPEKILSDREHIYEIFQPWALKTYGDQAKTKTITMRKKARILKALEGKEHSRPDSSKFRFWVKSKAFTTKRPEGFEEVPGSQRKAKPFPPDAVLSDNPSEVDLFVVSTSKEFGQRTYRKVAVVEEFFDIIYNVHMELGGRSGMHAGQKRTYRIITETYAFLPREAVTRFLSTCPECKKNLRPSSPSASSHTEDPTNESSSEVEALNYSSHTESSIEAGPTKATGKSGKKAKKRRHSSHHGGALAQQQQHHSQPLQLHQFPLEGVARAGVEAAVESLFETPVEPPPPAPPMTASTPRRRPTKSPSPPSLGPATASPSPIPSASTSLSLAGNVPKIRINPNLQRPPSPVREPVAGVPYAPHHHQPPASLPPSLRHSLPLQSSLPPALSASLASSLPPSLSASLASSLPPSLSASLSSSSLQSPFQSTLPPSQSPLGLDFASLKTQESLMRYYEFMRRFYGVGVGGVGVGVGSGSGAASFMPTTIAPPPSTSQPQPLSMMASAPVLGPPLYGSPLLQSLRYLTPGSAQTATSSTVSPQQQSAAKKKKHRTPPPSTSGAMELSDDDDDHDDDDDGDGDDDEVATPTPKKFKPMTSSSTSSISTLSSIPPQQLQSQQQQQEKQRQEQQPQQSSAINLSQTFHFSSNGKQKPRPSTASPPRPPPSATAGIKVEATSPSGAASSAVTSTTAATASSTSTPMSASTSRLLFKTGGSSASTIRIPQVRPTLAATSTPTATTSSSLPPLDLERLKPITSTYLQLTRSMGLSDEDALRFDNLVSKDFKYSL